MELRAGNYGFYKPIVDVYGPLTKNLAFRVVGTYENAKSYRDVVTQKRLYVNPSLLYKFGEKTELLVQGDYLRSDITPDAGVGVVNLNAEPQFLPTTPRSRFINMNWAYNVTDQASGSAVLTHRFSDQWRLSAIAGGQDTRVHAFGAAVPNNAIVANGDYTRSLSAVGTSERDYNGQLNLNGKFDTGPLRHQLLVGGDALRIRTTSATFKYQATNGKIGTAYGVINILDRAKYAGAHRRAGRAGYGAYYLAFVPVRGLRAGFNHAHAQVLGAGRRALVVPEHAANQHLQPGQAAGARRPGGQ
ncbi:MAG: hypothetical protein WKG07_33255 [Hymenobacter sp.]